MALAWTPSLVGTSTSSESWFLQWHELLAKTGSESWFLHWHELLAKTGSEILACTKKVLYLVQQICLFRKRTTLSSEWPRSCMTSWSAWRSGPAWGSWSSYHLWRSGLGAASQREWRFQTLGPPRGIHMGDSNSCMWSPAAADMSPKGNFFLFLDINQAIIAAIISREDFISVEHRILWYHCN